VATQDEICPGYIGDRLIRITVADPTVKPLAGAPVDLLVDYSACDALGGVCLPLELVVSDPKAAGVELTTYLRAAPRLLSFTPRRGAGTYTVLLRETGHNLWLGTLRVPVEG